MNAKNDKLEAFIIYLRVYAVEYFDDKFQFQKPAIIPEVTINGELRRNIFLCIKEALNNIVKHAFATEASLTIDVVANKFIITIKDNGIGIKLNENKTFGNGINTMRERLKKYGGNLEIEACDGTKLIFDLIFRL